MRLSSLPEYLAPGALPNGATKAAQFLHSLRHSVGTSVGILGDVERNKKAFEALSASDQKEAGEQIGHDPELILKAANSLLDARPDATPKSETKLSVKQFKGK